MFNAIRAKLLEMVERFVNYLETFDIAQLQKLFAHVDVSLAVFRSLNPLERQFVMRLLFVCGVQQSSTNNDRRENFDENNNSNDNNITNSSINTSMFEKWTESVATSNSVTRRLVQLGILEVLGVSTGADGGEQVRLCPAFANSVASLVLGSAAAGADQQAAAMNRQQKNSELASIDVALIERAKQHADTRWRSLMGLLVNVAFADAPPVPSSVVQLLIRSELARDAGNDSLLITNKGFQFLLDSHASQLWILLLTHLSNDYVRMCCDCLFVQSVTSVFAMSEF